MTAGERCTGSASPDPAGIVRTENERMCAYKRFAVAFSYPDDAFFSLFSDLSGERERLVSEYDALFRRGAICLYGAERTAENEFRRAIELSDIMGFYRAFGVQPDRERPDAMALELEFMHLLCFKLINALRESEDPCGRVRAALCRDAQRKFFARHLLPAAKKTAGAIIGTAGDTFYAEAARALLEFLEAERRFLKRDGR